MHNHHLNPTLVVLMPLNLSDFKRGQVLVFPKKMWKNECIYDIVNGS